MTAHASRPASPLVLGVLVSGSGTNLKAILDAIDRGSLPARVGVVISNVATAPALGRAETRGVPTAFVDHRAFSDRREFDRRVVEILRAHEVGCVVLAGFMRIVTPVLLDAFPHRVVNVHPALLPSFPGTNAQAQAIAHGVRVSGCTVHLVDSGTDTGPILAQAAVEVREDDDEASLGARILEKEHELLPRVLTWIAESRIHVSSAPGEGRARVRIDR